MKQRNQCFLTNLKQELSSFHRKNSRFSCTGGILTRNQKKKVFVITYCSLTPMCIRPPTPIENHAYFLDMKGFGKKPHCKCQGTDLCCQQLCQSEPATSHAGDVWSHPCTLMLLLRIHYSSCCTKTCSSHVLDTLNTCDVFV